MLNKLLGSKKFIAMLIGVALEALTALDIIKMDATAKTTFMEMIAAVVASYMISQGAADFSKEKALAEKVEPPK